MKKKKENISELFRKQKIKQLKKGEYPLSESNQLDFDQKVRGAFKLPHRHIEHELVKNHSL